MTPDQAKGTTRENGFTLIEVMITVAIVAILTTLALPSYNNYLLRVNRGAAAQFMMDVANRQEQYILDQRAYVADRERRSLARRVLREGRTEAVRLAARRGE